MERKKHLVINTPIKTLINQYLSKNTSDQADIDLDEFMANTIPYDPKLGLQYGPVMLPEVQVVSQSLNQQPLSRQVDGTIWFETTPQSIKLKVSNTKPKKETSLKSKRTLNTVEPEKTLESVTPEQLTDNLYALRDPSNPPEPNGNAPYGYKLTGGGGSFPTWVPITYEEFESGMRHGSSIPVSDPADNALNWLLAGALPAAAAGLSTLGSYITSSAVSSAMYPWLTKGVEYASGLLGKNAAKLAAFLGLSTAVNSATALNYLLEFNKYFPNVSNQKEFTNFLKGITSEEELKNRGYSVDQLRQLIASTNPNLVWDEKYQTYRDLSKDDFNWWTEFPYELPVYGAYGYYRTRPSVRDYYNTPKDATVTLREVTEANPAKQGAKTIKIGNTTYTTTKNTGSATKTIPTRQFKHPTLYRVHNFKPGLGSAFILADLGLRGTQYISRALTSEKDKLAEAAKQHRENVAEWARNIIETYYSTQINDSNTSSNVSSEPMLYDSISQPSDSQSVNVYDIIRP